VPLREIAGEVSARTRLVACSHVGWVSGDVAPSLAEVPADVPVLLDGAQGIGAIGVDVVALGCAFYAGSGQKWLCGPVGTGLLWISPDYRDRVRAIGPTYANLEDPALGLDAVPATGAARHDTSAQSLETAVAAATAFVLLATTGWDELQERAAALAESLVVALTARGFEVAPRDRTTLVAWKVPDPAATKQLCQAAGVIIRDLPGTGLVRASVGAWNDETDLQRLLAVL